LPCWFVRMYSTKESSFFIFFLFLFNTTNFLSFKNILLNHRKWHYYISIRTTSFIIAAIIRIHNTVIFVLPTILKATPWKLKEIIRLFIWIKTVLVCIDDKYICDETCIPVLSNLALKLPKVNNMNRALHLCRLYERNTWNYR